MCTSIPSKHDYLAIHMAHQKKGNKMNIRQKIAQFAQYQRTLRELNALDTRQLNDLGITKGDIKNIARGEIVR